MSAVRHLDLGRMSYADALEVQLREHDSVLASRDSEAPALATVIAVEHDPPVITRSRRPSAQANILASPAQLEAAGVEVHDTDRGGDVTYHGPGQLVLYPIVDLNRARLRLHDYVRLLEAVVIEECAALGVDAARDPEATGVWTTDEHGAISPASGKVCAIGIRVRRWVSMHGLALNVDPDLGHFDLIVPCGLTGRRVTSFREQMGERAPTLDAVRASLTARLERALLASADRDQPSASSSAAPSPPP